MSTHRICKHCEEQKDTNPQVSCESCGRVSCCKKHDFCHGCERIVCTDCSEDYSHYGFVFTDGRHGLEEL